MSKDNTDNESMYDDYDDEQDEDLDRGDSLEDDEEEVDSEADEDTDSLDEENEEEEEEDIKPSKTSRIPKSRLDEVLNQFKAEKTRSEWLEAQLEKLIEQTTKQKEVVIPTEKLPEFDFATAEEEYASLLVEGEIVKAAKVRTRIDAARQAEYKSMIASIQDVSEKRATENTRNVAEETRFVTAVSQLEAKFPFLDADSDDFNEEAVDTVNALMNGLRAKGMSKTDALKEAVRKVSPLYTVETKTPKTSLGGQRKVEAAKKAAKASGTQPTIVKSKVSEKISSGDIDISKLSEKDFSKLSKAELKILRGD